MHKNVLVAIIGVVAILAVGFAGCTGNETPQVTPDEKQTYIVGIDGNYPPYSYMDKNGNPTGFDVESVQWIADEMGFNVKVQPMAWTGIIPSLQNGNIDMVYSGMTVNEERKAEVDFSKTYWVINQSVAVRDDFSGTIDDITDGKVIIGAQRGCTAAMWIQENLIDTEIMPADNLKLYDNFPLALTDLINKRVDAAMYDEPVVKESIKGKPLKMLGTIDTKEEYAIAVRKGDTELLNTLNEGLDKLMNSPKWQELIEKYNMQ